MARPVGSRTRPQFYTYVDETDRKEFAKWAKKNYKKDPTLAKWFGDQVFGKALQTIAGDAENPLSLQITGMVIQKDADSVQDKKR